LLFYWNKYFKEWKCLFYKLYCKFKVWYGRIRGSKIRLFEGTRNRQEKFWRRSCSICKNFNESIECFEKFRWLLGSKIRLFEGTRNKQEKFRRRSCWICNNFRESIDCFEEFGWLRGSKIRLFEGTINKEEKFRRISCSIC
jgi:hypothetical protein